MIGIETLDADPFVKIDTFAFPVESEGIERRRHIHQRRQGQKLDFMMSCFDYLNEFQLMGDYFEFGVHSMRTFRMALSEARRYRRSDMKFYAFDSFEGLPECSSVNPNWAGKKYASDLNECKDQIATFGVYPENITFVPGFYESSLTSFDYAGPGPVLINIDCDLEESTVQALNFIAPLLRPGAIIYLDDFITSSRGSPNVGQYLAWERFKDSVEFSFTEFLQVGWFGRSYIVV
jgi:O-methyltransferase